MIDQLSLFFQTDMGQNILAELFGILVTVLIVDQLIRSRDSRKLMPTKHIVYSKLMKLTDKIFSYIISSAEGSTAYRDIRNVYSFGNKINVLAQYSSKYIKLNLQSFPALIQTNFESGIYNIDEFISIGEKLTNIVDVYNQAIDPDLLQLVLKIDHQIEDLDLYGYFELDSDFWKQSTVMFILSILMDTLSLREWIEQKGVVRKMDHIKEGRQGILNFDLIIRESVPIYEEVKAFEQEAFEEYKSNLKNEDESILDEVDESNLNEADELSLEEKVESNLNEADEK